MSIRRFLVMAILLGVGTSAVHGADALSVKLVHELMEGASHAVYGTPATVIIRMDGVPVTFVFSVDAIGNITAIPQSSPAPVRQISIGVTTTNAGVVPNAVTIITSAGQVEGFSVATSADGTITGVRNGGPVTIPPPTAGTTVARRHDGAPGSRHAGDQGDLTVGGSDLVDYLPPPPPGAQVAGAGILFAPGTSPASQSVSPH